MTELFHHRTCHWSRRICFLHCFHTRETNKTSIARNTCTTNTIQAQSNYDWIISSSDMPLKPKDMLSSLLSYTRNKQDLNSQKHGQFELRVTMTELSHHRTCHWSRRICFLHCFHTRETNKTSIARNTCTTNTIQAQSNYDWIISSSDMPQQRRKCNFHHCFHEERSNKSAMEKTHAWSTQFELRVTMTELSHHWTCHWSRRICFHHCFHTRETNKTSTARKTRTTDTIRAQSNYDWIISSSDMPQQRRKCNFHHCFHEEKSNKSAMEKTHAGPTQFKLRVTMTGLSHHRTCHSNGGSVIFIIAFMRKSQTRAQCPKTHAGPTHFKLRVTMTGLSHHRTCHETTQS